MKYNNGRYLESKVVYLLDKTKIQDLNKEMRSFLRMIYGELDDNEIVRCEIVDGFRKPDFYVEYQKIRKYISLKTGNAHNLHEEFLETFIDFLKSINVPEEALNLFKFFFWGDGTIDGTSEKCFTMPEAKVKYPEKVKKFNEYFNSDTKLINLIVRRITFEGRATDNVKADYIFHYEEGQLPTVISKEQVWNYITSKNKEWFYIDNPHIGPLQFCQRNSNKKSKRYEFERLRVCFWWPRFVADLKFMHKYYVDWHRKK